jgi:hypothetical protein
VRRRNGIGGGSAEREAGRGRGRGRIGGDEGSGDWVAAARRGDWGVWGGS